MNAVPRLQPGCCVVCRLSEEGVGYHPFGGKRSFSSEKVIWTCVADLQFAKGLFHMPADIRTRIEREATDAAGKRAGAYLDKINKTDLAQLTDVEWGTFLDVFLEAFGEEMRERLGAAIAPF